MSEDARRQAGYMLRLLQTGEMLSMPHSRPMGTIGKRCHELRIKDGDSIWRLIYRIDKDEIIVFDLFEKKTKRTPKFIIDRCKERIKLFDS